MEPLQLLKRDRVIYCYAEAVLADSSRFALEDDRASV